MVTKKAPLLRPSVTISLPGANRRGKAVWNMLAEPPFLECLCLSTQYSPSGCGGGALLWMHVSGALSTCTEGFFQAVDPHSGSFATGSLISKGTNGWLSKAIRIYTLFKWPLNGMWNKAPRAVVTAVQPCHATRNSHCVHLHRRWQL